MPSLRSGRNQLECGIILRELAKSLHRRTRRQGKIALHFALEIIQISFQYFRLVRVRDRLQPKSLPGASFLQRHFASRFGIAHPLRPPPRSNQKPLSSKFQKIDRGREQAPAFTPAHLQKIIVGKAESKANQESKDPVEDALNRRGCAKFSIHIEPRGDSRSRLSRAGGNRVSRSCACRRRSC